MHLFILLIILVIKYISTESKNILQLISKSKIHPNIFPKIKLSGKNFFCYEYFEVEYFL